MNPAYYLLVRLGGCPRARCGTSIYLLHKTDKQEVDPGTKLIKKFLIEYLREHRQVPEVINRGTNHF